MSTQSIPGLWQLLEEVVDEFTGEACKVEEGLGEAQTNELLVSGVWPTNTHTKKHNVNISIFQMYLYIGHFWAKVASCTLILDLHLSFQAASTFRA